MTPVMFAFSLTLLFLGEMGQTKDPKSVSVSQESRFVSANVGDEVTLQCFNDRAKALGLYWYKQTLGQKPKQMSTYYNYLSSAYGKFHDEFKNNKRLTLDAAKGQNHLKITDLHVSDTATYYCAWHSSKSLEFMEGTTLSVGSGSETIQPGGSVNLNCTIQTGTCDGVHSVYWFRNTEESQPGLLYIQGGRDTQCERKPNQQSCNYNLPMRSLNCSQAGAHHCAVVSCGQILLGNRTEQHLKDGSPVLVFLLSGALTFTTILSFILACILLVDKKQTHSQCRESAASTTMNAETNIDVDNLHYAPLKINKASRPRRRDDMENECVYSRVKQ